ncbi:cytochrome c biogenesis protein CcdA [uncultured Nocardioides sp.]|uniref:cytochrome c biogenesis CcdA family protein n=1 Tax=uncultured Nocardioides sp. TaxID=198441 RepID=UPI00262C2AF3|nr:cytochrome c biogenesis protein CcdA [uncultured Nocardioides sp.]
MGDWFGQTAASGSLALALPVALVAGLVSFFSPCVIPLLPGYLSYATGLSGADLASGESDHRRGRMLAGSLLFVLGFSTVFVLIGTASGALGEALVVYRREMTIGLGVLAVVLGLAFMGLVPFLQRDARVHAVPRVGLAAAPFLGFLFGLGWTPCIGPTLGVIASLAITEGTAARGALLSGVYALGIGLPFVVAALAYRRFLGAVSFIRRHQVWVMRLGGLMMILTGLALLTGWWDVAVAWVQINLVTGFEVAV